MNNIQSGIIIGIIIGTLFVIPMPKLKTYYELNLISECEKDLPRSSTCELYAKEKINN